MTTAASAAVLLLPLLFTLTSQSIIQLPHSHSSITPADDIYCASWRFAEETNDAGNFRQIPSRCVEYVESYMTGERYASDLEVIAEYAEAFAKTVDVVGDGSDAWVFDIDETLLSNVPYYADHGFGCVECVESYMTGDRYASDCEEGERYAEEFAKKVDVAGDGSDAWVFDIDETLLSNVPYYADHGFGSDIFDENSFDEWVDLANAPALPASLNLYNKLQELGFTVFLLTGRDENQRNTTEKNLLVSGYKNWKKLLLRGPSDMGKPAIVYKSEQRKNLENEGYVIHGSSGDQWSDLNGFSVATRSFKLPNPMYYIA